MSDAGAAVVAPFPDNVPEIARLLDEMPLFGRMPSEELVDFASAFNRLTLDAGELLWRQGTAVEGLHVVVDGEAQVCRALPGERELELARIGAGDVLGEIPLLGGGTHSASVRALSPMALLFLDREEFNSRMLARQPGALELRRRIVAIACDRLRRLHHALALSAPSAADGRVLAPARVPSARGTAATLPPLEYVSRLPLFRRLNSHCVSMLLELGRAVHVPRGHLFVDEGAHPPAFFITLRGAVEDVLQAGGSELRVGLCGPGRAFGYLGLLDGSTASVASVARERSTVLAIDAQRFAGMMSACEGRARAFRDAVEADLMLSLRDAEKPVCWAGSMR